MSINEGLAGVHVLAVVVVHHLKALLQPGSRVRRAAPNHFGALLLQLPILAKGRFGGQLGLWVAVSSQCEGGGVKTGLLLPTVLTYTYMPQAHAHTITHARTNIHTHKRKSKCPYLIAVIAEGHAVALAHQCLRKVQANEGMATPCASARVCTYVQCTHPQAIAAASALTPSRTSSHCGHTHPWCSQ